jgi:hypothetical protein|nr:MAG TPA: hypothetical protein [Crassvirales sp.]
MLYDGKNNHREITGMVLGGKRITKYYTVINHTARLIWEGIRSCFGSGWWINDKPWVNDEGWKN